MIKFTIVTITYNAAPVFMRTADSVLAQTYRNVEHIIVDGASNDGTADLASDYKRRSDEAVNGHEVRVVSEPDKGLYDAMNKGLRLATGDYVCFLNAGDFFPDASILHLIYDNARLGGYENDKSRLPAVLYGDTDLVDGDGRFVARRRLAPPERLTWRSFRSGMLVCHQAFYARVDIARRTPYDLRYRFSADVDWCIRVMKEAARMRLPLANVHATVACYQREGQTTENHRASLRERFDVMRRHYGLVVTLAMHAWFVVRAVLKRGRS